MKYEKFTKKEETAVAVIGLTAVVLTATIVYFVDNWLSSLL